MADSYRDSNEDARAVTPCESAKNPIREYVTTNHLWFILKAFGDGGRLRLNPHYPMSQLINTIHLFYNKYPYSAAFCSKTPESQGLFKHLLPIYQPVELTDVLQLTTHLTKVLAYW